MVHPKYVSAACIGEAHDRIGAAAFQLTSGEDPRVVPREANQDGTTLLGLHQLLPPEKKQLKFVETNLSYGKVSWS